MKESLKFVASKTAKISAPFALGGAIAADIISYTKYRPDLLDFMEEHAGNLGFTGLFTLLFHAGGSVMEAAGETYGIKSLQSAGEYLRRSSVVIMTAFTAGVEAQFIRNLYLLKENLPDAAFGMVSIGLGLATAHTLKKPLTTMVDSIINYKEHRKQRAFNDQLQTANHLLSKYLERNELDYYVPSEHNPIVLSDLLNHFDNDIILELEKRGSIRYAEELLPVPLA